MSLGSLDEFTPLSQNYFKKLMTTSKTSHCMNGLYSSGYCSDFGVSRDGNFIKLSGNAGEHSPSMYTVWVAFWEKVQLGARYFFFFQESLLELHQLQ